VTTWKKNKGAGLLAYERIPEMKFLSENEIEIRKTALIMIESCKIDTTLSLCTKFTFCILRTIKYILVRTSHLR
jgi:hypothetical protein